MKLLTELTEEIEYITEDSSDGKNLYLKGILLQAGIKNRNGRIYPPPVLEREVGRYIKEHVNRKTAYGELGHPATSPSLNHDKVSHRITEITRDGNNFVGKAIILNEGNGKIVRGMIETGGAIGISSRGLGSLKEDTKLGAKIVQDDYRLVVGGDLVINPSAPDAFLDAVFENVEWSYDPRTNEWVKEMVEPIRKNLKTKSLSQLQEQKVREFGRFLKLLSGK